MKWLKHNASGYSPIGLDLGDCVIKAAQLRPAGPGEKPRLVHALALERLHPGEPFDRAEALRLRDVLDRQGFRGRRAVVCVPGKHAMTSILTLPPRKDGVPLDQIVRAEIAHAHRREPDSFEAQWWELPKPARAAAGTHAMAVACTHETAEALLSALGAAGIDVIGLDMEGWAVARACAPLIASAPNGPGLVASVDLGWDSTTLVLLHEDAVVYERSTFGSGIRLLRKTLEEDQQYPPPVVDYMLYDIGFELEERGKEDDWRLLSRSVAPLQSHFDQVVRELSLSLDYARSQYPATQVSRVLLMGGGAVVPGVADYMGSQLDAPVTVARPIDVTCDGEAVGELAQLPSLMLAVGLAQHDSATIAKEAA